MRRFIKKCLLPYTSYLCLRMVKELDQLDISNQYEIIHFMWIEIAILVCSVYLLSTHFTSLQKLYFVLRLNVICSLAVT